MFKVQINVKKKINTVHYISTSKSPIICWTCSTYFPNIFFNVDIWLEYKKNKKYNDNCVYHFIACLFQLKICDFPFHIVNFSSSSSIKR